MTLALRATIRHAAFSGWREYSVTTANDDVCTALASVSRCYDLAWGPIGHAEPVAGEELQGLVEASLQPNVCQDMPDYALVEVQYDAGTVRIWVHRSQLVQRPQESLDEMLARRVASR